MKAKLAELLLKRKELNDKVSRLREINKDGLLVIKTARKPAHEGLDDIVSSVPKVAMTQVTHCYDWHAKNLRLVDAAIQQANWGTEVEVPDSVMEDYVDVYVQDEKAKK